MYKSCIYLLLLCSLAEQSPALGQTLSDYLWEQTNEYQQQALTSTFIYGMKERCLDPTEFGGYMVDLSVINFEIMDTVKTAADNETKNNTLKIFLTEEAVKFKIFSEYLYKAWHIKSADGITLSTAGASYVSHIRDVVDNEEPVYVIFALIPYLKMLPWAGKQMGSETNNFGLYTSFVKVTFNSKSTQYQEYQDYVEWAYQAGTVTDDKALQIFTTSMQCIVNFLNSVTKCTPSTSTSAGKSPHILPLGFFLGILGVWMLNAA